MKRIGTPCLLRFSLQNKVYPSFLRVITHLL